MLYFFQEIPDVINTNMTLKLTRTDSPNGICVLLHHVHRQYPVVELCIVAGNVAPQVGQEKGEIIPRPVPMCCRDTFWDWFPASLSFFLFSEEVAINSSTMTQFFQWVEIIQSVQLNLSGKQHGCDITCNERYITFSFNNRY